MNELLLSELTHKYQNVYFLKHAALSTEIHTWYANSVNGTRCIYARSERGTVAVVALCENILTAQEVIQYAKQVEILFV